MTTGQVWSNESETKKAEAKAEPAELIAPPTAEPEKTDPQTPPLPDVPAPLPDLTIPDRVFEEWAEPVALTPRPVVETGQDQGWRPETALALAAGGLLLFRQERKDREEETKEESSRIWTR